MANLKRLERQPQVVGLGKRLLRKSVLALTEADCQEVLALLSDDPIATVHLRGMLEDYGVVHAAHRGQFFGYYENHELAGVALLGHAILLYGKEAAFPYFAQATLQAKNSGQVIFGPRQQVEAFWSSLEKLGRQTRLVRDYHWFVSHRPAQLPKSLQLRKARLEDLEAVANAHAEMVCEGNGVDPRSSDWQSFCQRVAERIKRGRVWVKIEDGNLVFKADLINQTRETSYLEGIWTHLAYRDQGVATQCLTELVHRLCRKGSVPCLVVEPDDIPARRVYERVGFVQTQEYQARYLKPL